VDRGRSLDLATLVGQVQQPPIRLGVFDLDTFSHRPTAPRSPCAERSAASAAFAAWAAVHP
jgi:hypothetical protein